MLFLHSPPKIMHNKKVQNNENDCPAQRNTPIYTFLPFPRLNKRPNKSEEQY